MINIKLNKNLIQSFPCGITSIEIIRQNYFNLDSKPIAALFNNDLIELNRKLNQNGFLEILTIKDKRSIEILNHSTAHLLAQAIKRIFPKSLLNIGPTIKEGFYYDIDFLDYNISENSLIEIEKMMHLISKEKLEIIRKEINIKKAYDLFKDNYYKTQILDEIKESQVSIYSQGEFFDLCRGIHLINTNIIQNFKLLKISGSYFKGNSLNKKLTRIYGISFFNSKDLKNYLKLLEERKQKDHKNINKEQEFFMLTSDVGLGFPLWMPKGATIRRIIERYIVDKELEYKYQHVYTPVLANIDLYKTSGHLKLYKENMFPIMKLQNDEEIVLRPMNCPHHMMIFKKKLRSYKDLPFKIAELGIMHRYEHSGAVSGLQRTRAMTLNDAHIFITENQIENEIIKIINFILEVYKDFNITEYYFNLSTRDINNKKKYFDNEIIWQKSESILKNILTELKIPYKESVGDAAFYGPKIDIQVLTALNNEETLSTIQLDFLLPKKFNLTYVGSDNKEYNPILIHRAIISTLERFMAFLIEKNKGFFPLWLAPIQVVLIPINNIKYLKYTQNIEKILKTKNFRTEINDRDNSLSYKIRESQKNKIPYQIVIGEKEFLNNNLTFREYGSKFSKNVSIEEFINIFENKIKDKK
ncbi:threonine--tRNA ligase [Texas Phoenix palm phytoplasma]|uniref:Threonine--tRNA ligase n=1 Tax=Texas Phoenix palm phytoplasma TaxID=176709 RepID=A0ABS5BJF4_9MOLU|nr:threonine--tRNA ligase [Texas Phoenix palm phytoplasma]MBP3059329.1 threonine--tRNA ligase [Texas Phoenix palm phytoplasma]